MKAKTKFTGVMPALVTPFKEDGKTVNTRVARELIDLHVKEGAAGFYVLGGTGEGLALSRETREEMCETAIHAIGGRLPAIVHTAAMNLDETIALSRHAEKAGAAAISAVPPLFFFYDDDDVFHYYKTIAESVSIPLIIYYHPSARACMTPKLIARIFEIDNVTGVKWSSNDFFGLNRLKDMTNGEMNIINGPDELLAMGLLAGADAGIGSTYNVMLPEFVAIYNAVRAGRVEEAHARQSKVNRVIGAMLGHEVIPAVKYALRMRGYEVGEATYPMRQMPVGSAAALALEKDLRAAGFPFETV